MINAFHGIGAYRGQRSPRALREMLECALDGVEICAADRPIGAFGIVAHGDCRAVFERDVYSYVDQDGRRELRQYSNYNWTHVDENGASYRPVDPDESGYKYVSHPSQREFEEFCADANDPDSRGYCEAWVKTYAIRAIWIKDWADSATKRAAIIMAKNRNVPLIVVSGKTRIWDVLDSQKLPVIPAKVASAATQPRAFAAFNPFAVLAALKI